MSRSKLDLLAVKFEGLLEKKGQSFVDVRSLPNVNPTVFGSQSTDYINKIVVALNAGIINLSGSNDKTPYNFQTVTMTPSLGQGSSGSLTALVQASQLLWKYLIDKRTNPYTIDEAKNLILGLEQKMSMSSFSEPGANVFRDQIKSAISNWQAILK